MRTKNLLTVAALTAIGIFSTQALYAQEPIKDNISGNIGGTRFVITDPASISGIKKINYADWGAAASPTITGAVIEKAYDTLGAATLLNGTGSYPSLTGKFSLIFRGGGISFSDKVNRSIAAGAIGVIIVNNIPGDPVGMAPTPTGSTVAVPVLMISDVDGQAISDAIKLGTTVKLTLGTWNTGGTHDLGILSMYQATPHALNIPYHQLKGSAGTIAFKNYVGGAVANYGTVTETSVNVTDSVFWTPNGKTASFVTANTYNVPSISVSDSIRFGFGTTTYDLVPTIDSYGKYDHKYSISYGSTDDFPQDNTGIMTQYVTDSVYCKGNYNYTTTSPKVTLGIRPGVTPPITFLMGNTYYVKNGGYAARNIQFSLSILPDDGATLNGFMTNVFINKWTDGVGGDKDSIIQSGELKSVGICAKNFTTADSSGKTITIPVLDIVDPTSGKPVILEDDSWYYITVEVPAMLFIGIDGSISPFTRTFAQWKLAGSKPGSFVNETSGGIYTSDFATFTSDAASSVAPYPFSGNGYYIDSAFYDRNNEIPAITLLMSKEKVNGVKIIESTNNQSFATVFPNPAQNEINVEVALNKVNNNVTYRITDILGRSVYSETHKNIQNEKFTINTSNIANGNYYLLIVGDNNTTDVKKITIQK